MKFSSLVPATLFVYISFILAFSTGCKRNRKKAPDFPVVEVTQETEENENEEGKSQTEIDIERAAQTLTLTPIAERSPITMAQLDSLDMRITGARVGKMDFMQSTTPVLSFFRPTLSSMVEIIRCRKDTQIRGVFDSLDDVVTGISIPEEINEIMLRNDFWKSATESKGCLQIAINNTEGELFDAFAKSGSYFYVLRSCVEPSRVLDPTNGTSKRFCSKQVTKSTPLNNYQNERIDTEMEAQVLLNQTRDEIDGLGRQIHDATIRLNNALSDCAEFDAERASGLLKKTSITNVLAFGIGIGSEILSPGSISGQSHQASIQDLWSVKDSVAGNSGIIAQGLSNLFSSSGDFPLTCTEAVVQETSGKILVDELKVKHLSYGAHLDRVENARSSLDALQNKDI